MTVVLETARLLMRPPVVDDLEALFQLTQPAPMRRFLSMEEASREDAFARLLRNAGSWALYGYGTFIVREREGGAFVGSCGLFRTRRGLGPDFDESPEAGWIVAQQYWGRGYAVEAMRAAIDWFARSRGEQRTVCLIAPDHPASETVAARLGYVRFAERTLNGEPVNLYERVATSG